MTAKEFRRIMRRQLDPYAIRASEANERIALQTLRLLVQRGVVKPT